MTIKRLLSLALALVLVLSCVPMGVKAAEGIAVDEANFPDDNFRAWILEQDYGADGVLTQEELVGSTYLNTSGITYLNVSRMGIQDLTGIEHFSALESLYCDENQLTSLDVSKNTALKFLGCSQNPLTILDVSNNTALAYLSCCSNLLTSLDVSENTVLTQLFCSGNQLTSLDVSNNAALMELSCHTNQLTSLDVSENTALTDLCCNDNQLTNLDVSRNTALKTLWCSSNQLTNLDVSRNTSLEELRCFDNHLTNLDVSRNTALEWLECTRNKLTTLDISKNTALTDLSCDYNQLTNLDVSRNTSLEWIQCSHNQLTDLDVSSNIALELLSCGANQLTNLDLSRNAGLESLECSDNQLANLDISHNTVLVFLSCYGNQLISLDVTNNATLTTLYCFANRLTSLDVSNNPNLENLDCSYNYLPIEPNEMNQFDLATLAGNFDVTKTSNWSGGTVNGNILTVTQDIVTYTYQVRPDLEETFTLTCGVADAAPVTRESGENRFDTATLVADQMKEALGVEKFNAVILANGYNFADALAGSYLSAMKQAPILLTWNGAEKYNYLNDATIAYVKANLKPGGTVYILGGTSAVPASIDAALKEFNIQRMDGANRFETNLMILEEAGIADGAEVLVCTSTNFADSLSASAAGKPILLVFNESGKLYGNQPEFLAGLKNCTFTVIGGESAVSQKLADAVGAYGTVTRLAGKNRFETSVMVAEKYFPKATSAVLAYAWDFPDGLCGGGLAYTMGAPLILTMTKYESQAADYIQGQGIKTGVVLGGEKLISEGSVHLIFNLIAED